MQFGVIAVKKNDICSVLVSGYIEDLDIIYNNIIDKYEEDSIKIIQYDEEKFNEIKNSALEVHKALEEYFIKQTISYDFLEKKD